jgi:hypothetical protein
MSMMDTVVTENPYLDCVQRREHGQPGDECVEPGRIEQSTVSGIMTQHE